MVRVFLHTHPPGSSQWRTEHREFFRIPIVGEYLTLAVTSPWYRVAVVVHTPFSDQFEAELYAVEVDHLAALRQAANGSSADPPVVDAAGGLAIVLGDQVLYLSAAGSKTLSRSTWDAMTAEEREVWEQSEG